MKQKLTITSAFLAAISSVAMATTPVPVQVTVEPTTAKYLGTENEFDRSKFVGIHMLESGKDADFKKFKREYNIDEEFIGSRRFYYPISMTKSGNIPSVSKVYSGTREVKDYIATSSPSSLFYDKEINYAKTDFMPYIKSVARYIAESYKNEWDDVPRYLEPFNEPMVHAPDFAKNVDPSERKDAIDAVVKYICEYHREVARAIKSTPELKNIELMGFGSAYPELEANDFGLWETRFKQFIDIAGDDIDILSVHLYDGSGINNQGGRRTGSNLEAILDILQTYSYIKLGTPMPIAITEYGRLVPNQPAWAKATGAVDNNIDESKITTKLSNYNHVTNSQAVRSQLHMVTAFMNRQNELVRTVPFTIGKAPQKALYSKSSLWVQQEDGTYDYSQRVNFFEMLKDLEGHHVVANSDDVDVQTLALVDDNKLYLLLNNLEEKNCEVSIDNILSKGLKEVSVKSLKIFNDKIPELKTTTYRSAPKTIPLEYGETIVLTYTYKKDIDTKQEVVRTKYYSKDYLKAITSNGVNKFSFNGVKTSSRGEAILRLGVNREHGNDVVPSTIKINGKQVTVKKDVVKGYDQSTRKEFFGALEIPFDISLLKSGENCVEVSYNDNKGGFVSTAILQLQTPNNL